MRSYVARIKIAQSIVPASYNAAANGAGVNLLGFDANVIEISTGVFGGAATAKIQESADNSTFTDVADSNLDGVTGNPAGFSLAASTVKQIGYLGSRQFVRVILTASTTGNLVSASVLRTEPKQVP